MMKLDLTGARKEGSNGLISKLREKKEKERGRSQPRIFQLERCAKSG
jgi:hypothetical protein